MRKNRFIAFSFMAVLLVSIINPAIYSYQINTHRALSELAARRADSDVESFLIHELLMAEGLNFQAPNVGTSGTKSLLEWIQEGSEREDDYTIWPAGRFFNHFYNPITGKGLNDFIGGIGSGQKLDSLNWAWGNKAVVGENLWGWLQAREYYFLTLITPWEENMDIGGGLILPGRKASAGMTFRALGQVIHLIQDLGQPQHTRNDAHTPLEGAPLEDYCSMWYGSANQLAGLASEPLPRFLIGPPTRDISANSEIPQEIINLWNTGQYQGVARKYYRGSLGLAEYSNSNFITDDTMFTGQSEAAFSNSNLKVIIEGGFFDQHRFPYPRLENTDLDAYSFGELTLYRGGQLPPISTGRQVSQVRLEAVPNLFTASLVPSPIPSVMGLTNDNYQSHAQKLLPKAISYSAALLKYFFRGRLALSSNGVVEVKLGERPEETLQFIEIEVRNESGKEQTIEQGVWALLTDGDTAPFNRIPYPAYSSPELLPLGDRTITLNPRGYKGKLAFGESFTIWVPKDKEGKSPLPWEKKPATLVFQGTLGNEKNTAVVAKRFGF